RRPRQSQRRHLRRLLGSARRFRTAPCRRYLEDRDVPAPACVDLGGEVPRPLAGVSGGSALASIIAIVVGVGLQGGGAFLFLLLGLLLSYVVILSLGVRLWLLTYLEPAPTLSLPTS